MDTLKSYITLIVFCCVSIMTMAQSSTPLELAENRVAEINEMITSVDPNAALTADQKRQIMDSHIARTEKIRTIKTSNLSETEKESKIIALRKEFGRNYTKNILTQEQRQAKKSSKGMLTKS